MTENYKMFIQSQLHVRVEHESTCEFARLALFPLPRGRLHECGNLQLGLLLQGGFACIGGIHRPWTLAARLSCVLSTPLISCT